MSEHERFAKGAANFKKVYGDVLPMPDRAFLPGVGFPVIAHQAIVEMKYRREPPAVVLGDHDALTGLEMQTVVIERTGA